MRDSRFCVQARRLSEAGSRSRRDGDRAGGLLLRRSHDGRDAKDRDRYGSCIHTSVCPNA